MSKYILSRVKPALGFHLEVVDGIQIGRPIIAVKPSDEFVNLFMVQFEGSEGIWYKVLYLQRTCDVK